jgi:hypothetical protein
MILMTGVGAMAVGSLHYTNYWGEAVFAPFAMLVGALCILTVFRWGK